MKRHSHFAIWLVLLSGLSAEAARAQDMPLVVASGRKGVDANVKVPAFDVVSVKEHKSDDHMMGYRYSEGGFTTQNMSVKSLIAMAYGVRPDLISGGPGWMPAVGYDINAKVASEDLETLAKLGPEQRTGMLAAVLEDRFKLKTHRETKMLPTYDLVVAKGGPHLKDAAGTEPSWTTGTGMFKLTDSSAQSIADQLAHATQHNVADKTGLKGMYDVELKWTPEDSTGDAPPIFTAVQEQLGLRLQPSKGPVETLVVDHLEKPTEN
jgi:uncharacterized protein (TIGR03435 family)